ncbi:diaminopimelate decarboxylase family protein [Pseudoalteromonas sp. T1lg48]|uniref:diaminopimelate decarboxylase family protein n=1 Tax=Pseudoalteromonas sp. T1lg48 TaxID=2077100 RepID=UPI002D795860|nr:hypothetical protein [Pseudoalteromonas sp. T1lg48]
MQVEDVTIGELAKHIPTPFYCYSAQAIASNYQRYSDAFAGLDSLICYAVKANSNQAILATLAQLGAGADTVSEGEIRRALAAGIKAEKIVFAGVGKSEQEIRYALAQGILQFNVESEPELERISALAVEMNTTAAYPFALTRMLKPKPMQRSLRVWRRISSALISIWHPSFITRLRHCRVSKSPAWMCI